MTALYYPRLPDSAAAELLVELTGLHHGQLVERAALEHRATTFYPTRTSEVTKAQLEGLQAGIRHVAAECGYPRPATKGSPATRDFDQRMCGLLFDSMNIVVADAANDGVWSFLSLVLVPDVSFWRFPNRRETEDYERLLGRPRNVLRRLWWRAHNVGADLGARLLEDEAVAILERSTIGGNPTVARTIACVHLDHVSTYPSLQRTEILRDAMKRIRRLAAVVALGGLLADELTALVSEAFAASVAALQSS